MSDSPSMQSVALLNTRAQIIQPTHRDANIGLDTTSKSIPTKFRNDCLLADMGTAESDMKSHIWLNVNS